MYHWIPDIFHPNIGHSLFIAVATPSHVAPDYQALMTEAPSSRQLAFRYFQTTIDVREYPV